MVIKNKKDRAIFPFLHLFGQGVNIVPSLLHDLSLIIAPA